MAHTSADTGGSKCAKGLVLLAVLGLRVGWSRRKIAKQDDVHIKDASRTLRLITTRRWRRKVMSEPPTMPVVPRFDISPKPVWGQHSVSERSDLRFRFFEAEEVEVAAAVSGDDKLESIGKCTAPRTRIAGEGGQDCSGFKIPHFYSIVPRRRDRALPVRR